MAAATEVQLTTTSPTNVLSQASSNGIYLVGIYLRVITAPTVVTITCTYTDATGAQTITIVNGITKAVGSTAINPFLIAVAAGSTITITATAGTANQVFVSASIGSAL